MPAPIKLSPCANCCSQDGPCIYHDGFMPDPNDQGFPGQTWEVESGTWDHQAAHLLVASGPGLAWCKTAYPGATEDPYVMHIVLMPETVGDKARAIVNYSDTDNYTFLEIEKTAGTVCKARLYDRSGGVNTLLDGPITCSTVFLEWWICLFSGSVIAWGIDGYFTTYYLDGAPLAEWSLYCGLENISSGEAHFEFFWLSYHGSVRAGCYECPDQRNQGKATFESAVRSAEDRIIARINDRASLELLRVSTAEAIARANRCLALPCGKKCPRFSGCDWREKWLDFLAGVPKPEECTRWRP